MRNAGELKEPVLYSAVYYSPGVWGYQGSTCQLMGGMQCFGRKNREKELFRKFFGVGFVSNRKMLRVIFLGVIMFYVWDSFDYRLPSNCNWFRQLQITARKLRLFVRILVGRRSRDAHSLILLAPAAVLQLLLECLGSGGGLK